MKFALTLLLLGSLVANGALVPFYSDPSYQRDEPSNPQWFVSNNGQPSNLYLNGVWQSSESGTNDMNLYTAWTIHPFGVKVGVIDQTTHGDRLVGCVLAVSPTSQIFRHELLRWYPEDFANGISNCVANGARVIVMPYGWDVPNTNLYAALWWAQWNGAVICCSMLNQPANLEAGAIDYPYNWRLPYVLHVNSTDRNGLHYWSAEGNLTVGAPGRNIVSAGSYTSGTSWSVGLAAGAVAILMDAQPRRAPSWYVWRMQTTADESWRRINLVRALSDPIAGKR